MCLRSRLPVGMQDPCSIQQILAQPNNIQLVVKLLASDMVVTRSDLAKELCHRLELRDPKGSCRLATTLKALRELEAQGFWTLPEASVPGPRQWNPNSPEPAGQATESFARMLGGRSGTPTGRGEHGG